MKFTNSYNFNSTFDISGTIIGKGLELIKNKLFNNKEEKGAINGKSVIDCSLSGETSVEVSVEELIEFHKEYGDDFNRTVKYIKEELRPCIKEFMLAIDDATVSLQKTMHDAEDRERDHDEKVEAEKKSKKSE